ncbi:MAG: hypothetical protein VKJ24_04485 [Synechococcales bacterium]|nr:hypothetical protein [Synechococcales bacterium]
MIYPPKIVPAANQPAAEGLTGKTVLLRYLQLRLRSSLQDSDLDELEIILSLAEAHRFLTQWIVQVDELLSQPINPSEEQPLSEQSQFLIILQRLEQQPGFQLLDAPLPCPDLTKKFLNEKLTIPLPNQSTVA